MKILAVKMHGRNDTNDDFVLFDLKEVNYIDLWRLNGNSAKTLAFHTSQGSYIGISGIREAAEAYRIFGFEMYDASTLVNTARIKEINPYHTGSIIIFMDDSHTTVRKQVLE